MVGKMNLNQKTAKKMRKIPTFSRFTIIALGIGLIFSASIFKFTYNNQENLWKKEFINQTEKTILTLENKLEINERVLLNILAFFGASQEVDREGFKTFVTPILERNKFIQALSWVPRVSDNQRVKFENLAKKDGITSFKITERLKQGVMVRAGTRPEYYPVFFIDPFEGNKAAHGFDLASNPIRFKSIKESRDSGKILATEKIVLVQEEKKQSAILIFAPYYGNAGVPKTIEERRKKFIGIISGVYRLGDMFNNTISPHLPKGMKLSVFEGKEISDQNKIFGKYNVNSLAEVKNEFNFSGQNWTIVLQAEANFQNGNKLNIPFASAGATFCLFLFISIIMELNHSQKRQIENEVHLQTQDLLESRARNKAVVDNVMDGVITIDERGVIESFNPAAATLFGYEPSGVIGKNVKMLMPEPYSSEHDQYLKNYLESGISKIIGIRREAVGLRQDGTTFPLDLGISEIYMGETRMFTGIVRDITLQKNAEEKIDKANRQTQQILNSAGEGIFGLDLEGNTTFLNITAERILGYKEEELLGKLKHSMIHHSKPDGTPYPHQDCHIYRSLRNGKVHRESEEVFWRKDGTPVPVEYVSTPIKQNEKLIGAVVTFKDISERKRVERMINAHTKDLKRANEMLFRSNKELDDFAYIVSHDLKEPLRGIYNYSAFLKEDYIDILDEEGKSKLETLERLSKRMEALINSILYFARLGRNEDIMKPVDINAVLTNTLENMTSLLKESNVDMRIAKDFPTVHGNETRIGEVFQNLIANAIKYNDKPDKWVEIGYTYDGNIPDNGMNANPGQSSDKHSSPSVFYVKDNGIGILEKHFESLFRIFKRLNGKNKFSQGTGAGTTIVKKIIEKHNGKIWLESNVGEGTTFYFTLGGESRNENHQLQSSNSHS
jgi:two-component system sensor kinase FixL